MSNGEIHARIEALLEEDRLEDAMLLVDQLEPISFEALKRILDAAPLDDEPVTPEQRAALDQAWEILRGGGVPLATRPTG